MKLYVGILSALSATGIAESTWYLCTAYSLEEATGRALLDCKERWLEGTQHQVQVDVVEERFIDAVRPRTRGKR